MTGIAMQKFHALKGVSNANDMWPTLAKFIQSGLLENIDIVLAEHLLRVKNSDNEIVAAAICYLSKAAREGHLCVRLSQNTLLPLFDQQLAEIAALGFSKLPITIHEILDANKPPTKAIICEDNFFYLNKMWHLETRIADQLKFIQQTTPSLFVDYQQVLSIVEKNIQSAILLPEQGQAILQAIQHPVTIISGGPGTGKTYTAGHIVKILFQSLPPEQRVQWKIALAAPTGKAAANLQKSLFTAVNGIEGFPEITSKTLHSLLSVNNYGKKRFDAPAYVDADLILIDECSMIDLTMMEHLLKSIKPGCRLILLGDKHQLPPVEAGSIFADIIEYRLSQPPQTSAAVELKKCLRAELKGIVEFAEAVNNGDHHKSLAILSNENDSQLAGVSRLLAPQCVTITHHHQILLQKASCFPFLFDDNVQQEDILTAFNSFRILTPHRQGSFGVDTLNELFLQTLLSQVEPGQFFIAPIMIVNNDWRLQLFNGETGVLVKKIYPHQPFSMTFNQGDYVLLNDSSSSLIRKLPALLLPKFEFAYCLSVHKSQGSEFDNVLLLLPEGSETFGREVLYTGITRARKHLQLFCVDQTLQKTISVQSKRLSNLKTRLAN